MVLKKSSQVKKSKNLPGEKVTKSVWLEWLPQIQQEKRGQISVV